MAKNDKKDVQPIRDKIQIQEMKDALLQFCSYRDYVMFSFGINIGLRISDILKLKVKDVRNKKHIRIKEKKTDKYSTFRITNSNYDLLSDYTERMNAEDWLFPSRKGDGPISTTQAYRVLNKAADMIGLENIGTHTMRKTFGYHYYKKTKDVYNLMTIFRHSAPSITKRYIGVTQDEIDQTLEDFSL